MSGCPDLPAGPDYNVEANRNAYREQVRLWAIEHKDEAVALASAEARYSRVVDWIDAVDALTDHRTNEARKVEPPMERFGKVRAGWYKLAVVSLDESLASQRAYRAGEIDKPKGELYVDVARAGLESGEPWTVSVRGDGWSSNSHTLCQHGIARFSSFTDFADARRYAVALKAYLQGRGLHPDWLHTVFSAEASTRHQEVLARIGVEA